MATYMKKGNSHKVIFPYRDVNGQTKQQWETYTDELEAKTRKTTIDFLQKKKMYDALYQEVQKYKSSHNKDFTDSNPVLNSTGVKAESGKTGNSKNLDKTYREFVEEWFPIYTKAHKYKGNSYDTLRRNLDNHILPFFGHMIYSEISAKDIDDFKEHLFTKKCMGSQNYKKKPEEIPTLKSATVKKNFDSFMSGYSMAKRWGYVLEVPESEAPSEVNEKTKAMEPKALNKLIDSINDNDILKLSARIAFNCSLRVGETSGIRISEINMDEGYFWITQEIQRLSDEAIENLPRHDVFRVFPKTVQKSKSSLVATTPKNERSVRKWFFNKSLGEVIKNRLEEIKKCKEFYGSEYNDYDLFICYPDGKPIDPCKFGKWFMKWERSKNVPEPITFQGIRKTGQIHKGRISGNNTKLVSTIAGQTEPVYHKHYNEVFEHEKKDLAVLIETDLHGTDTSDALTKLMQQMQKDPDLSRKIVEYALQNTLCTL